MDIPDINILHKEKYIKEEAKNDVFNKVLNKCIEKILYTNKNTDQTFIYFEVPHTIINCANYDRISCIMFLMNAFSLKQYYTEFIEPYYLYIDWSNNSKNIDDNAYIKSITSNPEKLRQETKKLLKKYPNTNKIQYIYEDEIKKGKK
jgi:hypothetical protein